MMRTVTSERAKLEWLLVLSTRRCWTALSVMVLAAVGLLVLPRVGKGMLLPLAVALAGATTISGVVWFRAQHLVLRLHRCLGGRGAHLLS